MVMKKMILSAAAVAAFFAAGTSVASAQEFTWGPKGGLNVSGMSKVGMDRKAAFTAGLFGELRTNDWFALSAEALYSRQGAADNWHDDFLDVKVKNRIVSHYLNVPVLANFYVTENLALKTGVQAGFCLGANEVTKVGDTKYRDNVTDAFHTAELSIPVGISYNVGPVVLDARYNFGVTHAMKDYDARNNVFQLTAGLRF